MRKKRTRKHLEEQSLYFQLSEAMDCLQHICTEGRTSVGPYDKEPIKNKAPCSKFSTCEGLQQSIQHFSNCKKRVNRGCVRCKRMWQLFKHHSSICKSLDTNRVPLCRFKSFGPGWCCAFAMCRIDAFERGKDLLATNCLMNMYSKCNRMDEAESLFTSIRDKDLVSCNTNEYAQNGKSSCRDLKALYALLQSESIVVDTAHWNTIIAGCAQNEYFSEALETFDLMRREADAKHDSVTLVNAILACGNLELVLQGELVHGFAHKTLDDGDARVTNTLMRSQMLQFGLHVPNLEQSDMENRSMNMF